jgi:hypothetical protein
MVPVEAARVRQKERENITRKGEQADEKVVAALTQRQQGDRESVMWFWQSVGANRIINAFHRSGYAKPSRGSSPSSTRLDAIAAGSY